MRLLDLFCGGGLAGAGYWQSGCFSEIVGVDIEDMSSVYPFDFIRQNAITLTYDFLLQFDFIHASPPCQFYSAITPGWAREKHWRSIPPTQLMLKATGLPHVIENVPGSGHDLRPNLIMSGLDVGLPTARPRLFHVSGRAFSQINDQPGINVSAGEIAHINDVPGSQMNTRQLSNVSIEEISQIIGDRIFNVHGDEYVNRDELIEAFGLRTLAAPHLRRLTRAHIEQGIPPEMTRRIALSLFPKVMIA